jgi:hypothetical protein
LFPVLKAGGEVNQSVGVLVVGALGLLEANL